jgi:hypothetical protein
MALVTWVYIDKTDGGIDRVDAGIGIVNDGVKT